MNLTELTDLQEKISQAEKSWSENAVASFDGWIIETRFHKTTIEIVMLRGRRKKRTADMAFFFNLNSKSFSYYDTYRRGNFEEAKIALEKYMSQTPSLKWMQEVLEAFRRQEKEQSKIKC